jgi:hypothetical protein
MNRAERGGEENEIRSQRTVVVLISKRTQIGILSSGIAL